MNVTSRSTAAMTPTHVIVRIKDNPYARLHAVPLEADGAIPTAMLEARDSPNANGDSPIIMSKVALMPSPSRLPGPTRSPLQFQGPTLSEQQPTRGVGIRTPIAQSASVQSNAASWNVSPLVSSASPPAVPSLLSLSEPAAAGLAVVADDRADSLAMDTAGESSSSKDATPARVSAQQLSDWPLSTRTSVVTTLTISDDGTSSSTPEFGTSVFMRKRVSPRVSELTAYPGGSLVISSESESDDSEGSVVRDNANDAAAADPIQHGAVSVVVAPPPSAADAELLFIEPDLTVTVHPADIANVALLAASSGSTSSNDATLSSDAHSSGPPSAPPSRIAFAPSDTPAVIMGRIAAAALQHVSSAALLEPYEDNDDDDEDDAYSSPRADDVINASGGRSLRNSHHGGSSGALRVRMPYLRYFVRVS